MRIASDVGASVGGEIVTMNIRMSKNHRNFRSSDVPSTLSTETQRQEAESYLRIAIRDKSREEL